jgi:hypothetical protein
MNLKFWNFRRVKLQAISKMKQFVSDISKSADSFVARSVIVN